MNPLTDSNDTRPEPRPSLFEESTLRKLEQLMLVAGRVRVGLMKGDRRSRKRGSSIEFADYRDYSQGDDLRHLDWNVYARLERPFIKLLEEEEDLAVHVLVDSSASMDWPAGTRSEENKWVYALRLAGALGYIGLSTNDQVNLALLNSGGDRRWGPYRGQQSAVRLLEFLESGRAAGQTDLNASLRDYALRARRPGLLLLISDLLSPGGFHDGLGALHARGYEVAILHLLSPDELDPAMSGDLKLVDVETRDEAEISLDAATLSVYRRRVAQWMAEIATYCGRRDVHYAPITTNIPWERVVMYSLRVKGLVK